MKILVTGAAGFIGYHLCEKLIKLNYEVVGLDNVNDYYDVNLKYARLAQLGFDQKDIFLNRMTESVLHSKKMYFIKMDLENQEELPKLLRFVNLTWYVILQLKLVCVTVLSNL
jgi:UDP-glucuronate 4-epimerase